jgi:hypothetical protein
MTYPYPQLKPPSFRWNPDGQPSEPTVHEWIQTIDQHEALIITNHCTQQYPMDNERLP